MKLNNSTNINKITNHLSVQRNELIKRPRHMPLEFHLLAWDRHENEAGLTKLMRSQHSPPGKWLPTVIHTYTNDTKKTCTNSLPLKDNTYYHKNE